MDRIVNRWAKGRREERVKSDADRSTHLNRCPGQSIASQSSVEKGFPTARVRQIEDHSRRQILRLNIRPDLNGSLVLRHSHTFAAHILFIGQHVNTSNGIPVVHGRRIVSIGDEPTLRMHFAVVLRQNETAGTTVDRDA